jgi:hypothetical protein
VIRSTNVNKNAVRKEYVLTSIRIKLKNGLRTVVKEIIITLSKYKLEIVAIRKFQ